MQINGSLPPVLSTPTDIGSAGLQAEQRKAAPVAGEQPQTENAIKQAHLEMLVRIKNLLTAEQQATLERLRSAPGA